MFLADSNHFFLFMGKIRFSIFCEKLLKLKADLTQHSVFEWPV